MILGGLLSAIRALPEFPGLLEYLSGTSQRQSTALRLQRSARVPVAAAVAQSLGRPALYVVARTDRATTVADELAAWAPDARVLTFGEPNPLFYEFSPWGPRTIISRLAVLGELCAPAPDLAPAVIVASARALMWRTLPHRDFLTNSRAIKVGQALRIEKALESWVGAGYVPASIVVEPGQFARRGGIVDIFPATAEQPVRIELFGDEVETLRRFDPATQRSGDRVQTVTIGPAREALPHDWQPEWAVELAEDEAPGNDAASEDGDVMPRNLEFYLPRMVAPASLLEYLPEGATVMVDDWRELGDAVEELEEQAIQLRAEQIAAGIIDEVFPLPYHPWADLQDELAAHQPAPMIMAEPDDETTRVIDLGAHFHPGPRFGGQLKLLLEHLDRLQHGFDRSLVVTRQAERLAEMWGEQHTYRAPTAAVEQLPEPGQPVFVHGALSDGFRFDVPASARPSAAEPEGAYSLHILSDSEIFGWARAEGQRARRRVRAAAQVPEANYADLADGDYVVHMDFGIGRFRGLVKREVERVEREYLLIEYAAGDQLYVPIHQADRLTRYVGVSEEHEPALSRLGSPDWIASKGRAQEAVQEVAQDLLELYAKREATRGHSAGHDTIWQAELEASFPYAETEDQLRAIREVKTDMESPRPMDRLICGDVGYGKTEVALRAAFKAVLDGSQVAVLVPTTVLAQQHLHTFQARLGPYPVQVEMLSRFRSRAAAAPIVERLAQGQIDIIIGTHRLLQKDVQFKNLGLVIIDEEQRFGVTHKEYFKKLRTEVDVLTLTATPIPRTLYLSLTGVRDISTINTPPEERLPIVNHSGPFNDRLVRQAILRELDRDGQVFFVHNRVQSIGVIRQKLAELVPEARIGVAHGQMDEHELSRVMDQFTGGELDVLLCTSIIESGLDIPNANTLIVDRADTFGLAQLYQLRGRVGRGAARAYAYFLTDRRHRPTAEGYQRLETLTEQSDLGAGFGIAMRDLEMRGAGDILGARQHGHITAVGFHLYTRLLGDAVKHLRAQSPHGAALPLAQPGDGLQIGLDVLSLAPVAVDLPIAASLPSDYIEERDLRLRIYRRLADIRSESQLEGVAQELAERFGPLPRPVHNLVFQLRVKILAGQAGVTAIGAENGQIVLTVPAMGELDQAFLGSKLGATARVSKNRVWLGRAADLRADDSPWRRQLLTVLRELGKVEPAAP
jgi:transcription-repair coupling factor (superfamily II helicase)